MAQSKERQIAAQSSLKLVNEWATTCGKCLTLKELVGITNVIVDYVENGYSKELGDRLEEGGTAEEGHNMWRKEVQHQRMIAYGGRGYSRGG